MKITVQGGSFDPESDLEPSGTKLWESRDEELPAAVLTAMSGQFEPGTWYSLASLREIIAAMSPVERELEVTGAVVAEQFGVDARWDASIGIGQSRAALMVCTAVISHAEKLAEKAPIWIRVD